MIQDEILRSAALNLKDQVTVLSGVDRFIYTGTSMSPSLKERDILCVRTSHIKDFLMGDIIVYKKFDKYIIHRFLYKIHKADSKSNLILKGDNSVLFDCPIGVGDVIGKVISIQRADNTIQIETNLSTAHNFIVGFLSILEGKCVKCLKAIHWLVLRNVKLNNHTKNLILEFVKLPKAFFLLFQRR